MSRTTYVHLLARPGAAAFFVAAGAGRVGIAMTALGLLWLVHGSTGSYGTAGLVTAGVAVTEAVVGPQVARAVDRFGQSRTLLAVAPAHAVAVVAAVLLVTRGAPTGALVAGGALVGATIPQLGAMSTARWVALLRSRHDHLLPPAFSLESMANAIAYLLGPVLVSALAQHGHPAVGSALAGSLVVGGALVLALLRSTAPVPAPAGRVRRGQGLLGPSFLVVVALNGAMGAFFGSSQVAVTAFAVGGGTSAALLFGLSSAAGLLAGWAYGLRRWPGRPHRQLLVLGSALVAGCALLVVARTPPVVVLGLLVTGAVVPPVLVLCTVVVERSVPTAVLTQAFTWVGSASAAGSATAASVAGKLTDTGGPPAGFAVCVAAAVGVTLLAAGLRRAPR